MRPVLLSQVATWCNAHLLGDDIGISAIDIDSRSIRPGALFVALPGDRHDGHDHAAAALRAGAVAVLCERPLPIDAPQLVVASSQLALARIAAGLAASRETTVIAITGSNGKTTVKTLVHAILSRTAAREPARDDRASTRPAPDSANAAHGAYANPGNRNNEIGLPLAVIEQPEAARFGIYEMGAGQPGDIAYLTDVVTPDIALVNNIAAAHLERMGSLLGIAETKGAIYTALRPGGTAIINADDAFAPWFESLIGPATASTSPAWRAPTAKLHDTDTIVNPPRTARARAIDTDTDIGTDPARAARARAPGTDTDSARTEHARATGTDTDPARAARARTPDADTDSAHTEHARAPGTDMDPARTEHVRATDTGSISDTPVGARHAGDGVAARSDASTSPAWRAPTVVRFGVDATADIHAEGLHCGADGSRFTLVAPQGRVAITLPMPGRHNVANALAAAALALAAGATLDDVADGLANAPPVTGRLVQHTLANCALLIDDSYNANPGSVAAAITTLSALRTSGRTPWLVLGDMRELGPDAERLHADAGERARAAGIARLLTVGPLSAAASRAFGADAQHFASQDELVGVLRAALSSDEGPAIACLVKGSRGSAMDRIVAALLPATATPGGDRHAA